jgi:hypothetical protein
MFIISYLLPITYCLLTLASCSITINSARADTKIPIELNIPPAIIKDSPVLQKWLKEVPNILEDINHDPSFRTHFDLSFTVFPSNEDITGIKVAIEDVFLASTGFTISADYQISFEKGRVSTGTDLHYFLFPLGSLVNLAPLVGYRYIQSDDFERDGINLGLRLMLALSRTGAADISLSQSFINLGSDQEVGLFSVAVGYSISSRLRLSTDWEIQNSQHNEDNSFSIGLQYLF